MTTTRCAAAIQGMATTGGTNVANGVAAIRPMVKPPRP